MNIAIFMGSPRLWGNTNELCKPFINELTARGASVRYLPLAFMNIAPCKGCYHCQNVQGEYGCIQKDDMEQVVADIQWADCLILATPIHSWSCPAAMKSVLDRHYGLNKYYGTATGSLWAGKKVGLLLTHGYDRDYATEPFVTSIQRLCKHSQLDYVGMYSVQDTDNLASFQTPEAVQGAQDFARQVLSSL